MQNFHLFEFLPLWLTFAGMVAFVLLSTSLGIYVAKVRKRGAKATEEEGPIGTVAGATLGLLAFILAFTFGLTASRFDTRRQLLLDEVTAIETTTLRGDLIPEPHRSEVRDLMKKYLELRIEAARNPGNARERIKQSEGIQRQLWLHGAALAAIDLKNPDVSSLFVDSLNEMVNVQTRRVTLAGYHIPWLMWLVLFAVTVVSMIQVGYLFGRSGNTNWLFIIALALAFSGVFILIVDLDRGGVRATGAIQVNQQPMIDLHERLYGTESQ